jgi:YjbR
VALALPEAEERETWGHPTFRVRDRMFAALSDDGRLASVKATREEQAALIAAYDADRDIAQGASDG